jgi:hypothetical protein
MSSFKSTDVKAAPIVGLEFVFEGVPRGVVGLEFVFEGVPRGVTYMLWQLST